MMEAMLFASFHRMTTLFLDVVFPPRREERIVRELRPRKLEHLVLSVPQSHHGIHFLLPFQEPTVRAVIHEMKFYRNRKAILMLAAILRTHIRSAAYEASTIFIPIPLGRERMRQRGHNQVAVLLRETMTTPSCCCAIDTKSLVRVRDTAPQTSLPKEKRIENMKDAFQVADPLRIRGKHIVLVDDVITTGATMHAAKAALLLHAPASVTCLALAH